VDLARHAGDDSARAWRLADFAVPAAHCIFFLSGFSALLYQVVWQRLLTVYYGVGSVSITLIVSTTMACLGIGAYLGGHVTERVRNRARLYFVTELGIGLFGALSLFFLRHLGEATAGASHVVSFGAILAFVSVPTILMGATLPILTKILSGMNRSFFSAVSTLYCVNTLGAAAGALLGAYAFISFFGLDITLYVAASINFVLAFLIAAALPQQAAQREPAYGPAQRPVVRSIYAFIFICGFLAIGYEIVWFRLIEVLVKASPYSFSTVLGIYLLGIGLGSWGVNRYLAHRPRADKARLFYSLQAGIGAYVALSLIGLYYLTDHTFMRQFVHASFHVELHPAFQLPVLSPWKDFLKQSFTAVDILAWPAVFVLIPTLMMGASFPLLSSLAYPENEKQARTIGSVYFINILGNVSGGVATGFLLLPQLGTEGTARLFSLIGLGFCFALPARWWVGQRVHKAAVAALLVVVFLLFPGKNRLYDTLHDIADKQGNTFIEEGIEGVVVTVAVGPRVMNYINGLTHGGRRGYITDFYMSAIETMSQADKVDKILVIGYGTGATVEAALKSSQVSSLTIVELNRTLMKNLLKIPLFRESLNDPRIETVYDDARRFLLRTRDKYDVIYMDPLRSTTAYSNNLYSREFFELAKARLNPNGVIMVWADEHHVVPKTVADVFEDVRRYRVRNDGYVLATNGRFIESEARKREMFSAYSPEQAAHIQAMGRFQVGKEELLARLAPYPINLDRRPVTEYYLGLWFKERFFYRRQAQALLAAPNADKTDVLSQAP
jgi:predicted membrane-bound spermidine synthase